MASSESDCSPFCAQLPAILIQRSGPESMEPFLIFSRTVRANGGVGDEGGGGGGGEEEGKYGMA